MTPTTNGAALVLQNVASAVLVNTVSCAAGGPDCDLGALGGIAVAYTASTLPSDRDLQGLAGKHANYVMMSNLFISS